jgi:hypothetical protein
LLVEGLVLSFLVTAQLPLLVCAIESWAREPAMVVCAESLRQRVAARRWCSALSNRRVARTVSSDKVSDGCNACCLLHGARICMSCRFCRVGTARVGIRRLPCPSALRCSCIEPCCPVRISVAHSGCPVRARPARR